MIIKSGWEPCKLHLLARLPSGVVQFLGIWNSLFIAINPRFALTWSGCSMSGFIKEYITIPQDSPKLYFGHFSVVNQNDFEMAKKIKSFRSECLKT